MDAYEQKHIKMCKKFKKEIKTIFLKIDKWDEESQIIFLSGGYGRLMGSLDSAMQKLDDMITDIRGDEDEVSEDEFLS